MLSFLICLILYHLDRKELKETLSKYDRNCSVWGGDLLLFISLIMVYKYCHTVTKKDRIFLKR